MRKLVGVLVGLVALTLAAEASAFSAGDPGASGKTSGNTCGNSGCHTGGTAPTVKIDGPATLAAGATGKYTFTVTTTLTKTGMDIAGSDGVTFTAGTGDKLSGTELAQDGPQAASGSTAYTFSVVAPSSGTSMTLYGCGVGANGDGNSTGDGAATTTLAVTVTGGGAAAPATSASASTASGDDDSTSTKSTKTSTTSPTDPWNDTQSCAARGGPSPTGLIAATFVVLGLAATKRRRRK